VILALFAILGVLGPLLTMEWLIAIERRKVSQSPRPSLLQRDLTCVVLTLWLLFAWPIAIILLLTAMVTTSRKG